MAFRSGGRGRGGGGGWRGGGRGRGGGGGGFGGHKRPRDGNWKDDFPRKKMMEGMPSTLRILIRSMDAGGIIGKGGENIKRMRKTYDCQVTLPDSAGSPERVLTIVGIRENCVGVFVECLEKLRDEQLRRDSSNRSSTEVQVLIPQPFMGTIIGTGGTKIKDLRKTSGCNIKIFTEPMPNSNERSISLNGNQEQIISCVEFFLQEIASKEPKEPIYLYDPAIPSDFDPYGYPSQDGPPPHRPPVPGDYPPSPPPRRPARSDMGHPPIAPPPVHSAPDPVSSRPPASYGPPPSMQAPPQAPPSTAPPTNQHPPASDTWSHTQQPVQQQSFPRQPQPLPQSNSSYASNNPAPHVPPAQPGSRSTPLFSSYSGPQQQQQHQQPPHHHQQQPPQHQPQQLPQSSYTQPTYPSPAPPPVAPQSLPQPAAAPVPPSVPPPPSFVPPLPPSAMGYSQHQLPAAPQTPYTTPVPPSSSSSSTYPSQPALTYPPVQQSSNQQTAYSSPYATGYQPPPPPPAAAAAASVLPAAQHVPQQPTPVFPAAMAMVAATNTAAQGSVKKVTIPIEYAGAILGPGGARLQQIRSQASCDIKMEDLQPGSVERIITIRGSAQEIAAAEELMKEAVRHHHKL